jgi:hypothetical protein
VVHAYNPSYLENGGRSIEIQGWSGKSTRLYLKNKLKAKYLGYGLSKQKCKPKA